LSPSVVLTSTLSGLKWIQMFILRSFERMFDYSCGKCHEKTFVGIRWYQDKHTEAQPAWLDVFIGHFECRRAFSES
ncbi:hypothetical protein, partial [Orrella sp. 11846]|uniref:hypothetical protein n=1 Tax=Orrella sp. 11846 TaxID=3409913 RepID=UPI003B5BEEDB